MSLTKKEVLTKYVPLAHKTMPEDQLTTSLSTLYLAMDDYAEREAKAYANWLSNQVIGGRTASRLWDDYVKNIWFAQEFEPNSPRWFFQKYLPSPYREQAIQNFDEEYFLLNSTGSVHDYDHTLESAICCGFNWGKTPNDQGGGYWDDIFQRARNREFDGLPSAAQIASATNSFKGVNTDDFMNEVRGREAELRPLYSLTPPELVTMWNAVLPAFRTFDGTIRCLPENSTIVEMIRMDQHGVSLGLYYNGYTWAEFNGVRFDIPQEAFAEYFASIGVAYKPPTDEPE